MNSVTHNYAEEKDFINSIKNFFKKFHFNKALRKSNAYKEKGVKVIDVFEYLFNLVFKNRSMYMDLLNLRTASAFCKDTVYRFLNSVYINWQTFLLTISSNVINTHLNDLTSEDRVNVFIVDDTFYARLRSKCVEMLSYVYDHVDGKYKKGFRLLTLGWSDGDTFIPVNFSLLTSENMKKHICEMKEGICKSTNGFKRRIQAMTKAPEIMLQMLAAAIHSHIPADYVLFDSWFAAPATIMKILAMKLNVIARIKNTSKCKYIFDGNKMTLKEIYDSCKKRRGRSKYLLSVQASIYNKEGQTKEVRIVFVRDRNNRKKWIALISTNLTISEEEIIRIYGKRWNIEVFFKVCKSYLNLAKEFQGLSFDMITAHTAVVFSRYILLSYENRNSKDVRTLGELFLLYFDEVRDVQFSEALRLILEAIIDTLEEAMFLNKKQVNEFLDMFITKLPEYLKRMVAPPLPV